MPHTVAPAGPARRHGDRASRCAASATSTATAGSTRTFRAGRRARRAQDRAARRAVATRPRRQGCSSCTASVGEVTQDAESVRAAGFGPGTWRPPTDCTRRSATRWAWRCQSGGPRRWGIRRHVADGAVDRLASRCTGRDGAEAYVTPVADDCVGIAILSVDPRRLRQPLRRRSPTLRDRVHGHAHGQDRAAGPLRQRVRSRAAGRVLLVGDAAGYVDALTGEGIGLAFGAAELLVDCVVAERPERLRPPVAPDDPPLPPADGGPVAGQRASRRCARRSCPRRRRCPPSSPGWSISWPSRRVAIDLWQTFSHHSAT